MNVAYRRLARTDADLLVEFLTSDPWPFHAGTVSEPERIRRRVARGRYDGEDDRSFWVVVDGVEVGLIRILDLHSEMPRTDLRIRSSHRGKGLGTHALRWRTGYLFTELPELRRIEACCRQDNHAVRRVLAKCGYVKEAHFRDAWPDVDGSFHDSVIYTVLRSDWENGTVTTVDWDDVPAVACSFHAAGPLPLNGLPCPAS